MMNYDKVRKIEARIHPDGNLQILEMIERRECIEPFDYAAHSNGCREIPLPLGEYPGMELADRMADASALAFEIAGHKRVEEALLESEKRYRSLFENMPNGFAYCKMLFAADGQPVDFVYLNVNSAFGRLIGCEKVTGKKASEIFSGLKEAQPELFEIYGRVALAGQPETFDCKRLGKWLSITVHSPARNYFVAVIDDITTRKMAEQEREVTIKFLSLVNAGKGIHDMISTAAVFFQEQTGCQAVGIRMREGKDYPYFEARGFPKEFVLAENALCTRDETGEAVCNSDGSPLIECMCGNVICGRFDVSKPFFTAGGSFWTNSTTELLAATTEAERLTRTRNRCNGDGYESVALIPLRAGQESLGLLQLNDRRKGQFSPEVIGLWERLAGYLAVALAKFRTEEALKKANEELDIRVRERTAEYELVNKELESFSYSISHDLRAPLRHIDGFTRIFLEEYGAAVPGEGKAYLDRICKATKRMSNLIDDLLELSRITRRDLTFKTVNFSHMVQEITTELTAAFPRRQVEFAIEPGISARGDGSMLRIVLENLVENAWKYSSKKKRAAISFGMKRINGECAYYVRDNGAGFDMAHADNLFGVFQRLHRADEYEGTGVGLAIAKRIIQRHGGNLWAESRVNRGATFYFTIRPQG